MKVGHEMVLIALDEGNKLCTYFVVSLAMVLHAMNVVNSIVDMQSEFIILLPGRWSLVYLNFIEKHEEKKIDT